MRTIISILQIRKLSQTESDLFKVTELGRVDPGSDLGPGGYLGHHVGWEPDSPVSLDPDPQGPIARNTFASSLICSFGSIC